MKDLCTSVRRKARLITEIRYPASPILFDIRGKIIESIKPEIGSHLGHWRTDIGTVSFVDDLEKPKQEFIISLKRTAIGIEDFGTVQEFVDRTIKYLDLMYEHLGSHIMLLGRCGVRIIEICSPSDSDNFEDMVNRVNSRLLTLPTDLDIDSIDSMFRIVHKRGAYTIGPVKKGESWISEFFKDPSSKVPQAGIGLDIDSYVTDIQMNERRDLHNVFIKVYQVTKAIEESLLRHVGLINE